MLTTTSPQRRNASSEIPDKLYFRIGDVARICEVPAYVLRFWETEFSQLKPNKSGTGQRLYRKRDVELALHIKRLLYDEGYTIPGARQVFQAEAREVRKKNSAPALPMPVVTSNAAVAGLDAVIKELRGLATMLAAPVQPCHSPVSKRNKGQNSGDRKPGNLFEL
jgi:DNA-binding transcriptional MerR regulator